MGILSWAEEAGCCLRLEETKNVVPRSDISIGAKVIDDPPTFMGTDFLAKQWTAWGFPSRSKTEKLLSFF